MGYLAMRPAYLLLPISLAALVGASTLPGVARAGARKQPETTDEVIITRVSDDPPAASGMIAFAVQVFGRAGAEERAYLLPFMSIGQPRPAVGERCSVAWRWWSSITMQWMLAHGESVSAGRLVSSWRCLPTRTGMSAFHL